MSILPTISSFPLTLLVLFFFFLFLHRAQARQNCSPKSCGSNYPFTVRFPFRLKGQQPLACSYPGFDLICNNSDIPQPHLHFLSLNLPHSGAFWVRGINYPMQQIQLFDPQNCLPHRFFTLNLSSSPFSPSPNSQNITFLSCPPGPNVQLGSPFFTIVNCLSNSTVSIVATPSPMKPRAKKNMESHNCTTLATLPIPISGQQDEAIGWLNQDLNLTLTWDVPDCQGCEARGGLCGFANDSSDQVLCFRNPNTGNYRFCIS